MIYCYETDDGVIHEVSMRNSEREQRESPKGVIVLDDGREAVRNFAAELGSNRAGAHGWPLEVWSDGIHPSQAKELNDYLASKGVASVDVNSRGNYFVTSPSHHRAVLRARGKFNKDDNCSPRNV